MLFSIRLCGLLDIDDIEKAVNIFKENNCPFELMHCFSTYPMKLIIAFKMFLFQPQEMMIGAMTS